MALQTTESVRISNYQWRAKVRDSQGAESDWSDTWHFTIVNPNLTITELYFEPQDSDSEQVKIRACTSGQGGVGITMRVSVNDANDGSGNGTWHIIKELGVPCFNDEDAPIWNTLEYSDGPHRVRAEAHGADVSWDGAAVREEVYTLPHRRPASTRLLAPVPASEDIREAIYLNSRTVTFRWEPTIRADSYTLHIDTSPSPKDASNPVFRQTFDSSVTQHTVTFSQDYPTLYWQVSAANDVGTNASGDQLFGIDRSAPSCTVQPLPATTFESVFQVSWNGSDNLAGVRTFDIQYLDSDRGTWSDWLTGISATKIYELFIGQPGHTYSFRCRATDNANNMGDYPANADTSTKVDPAALPPTPWWDSAYSGKRNITILNNMPGTTLPTGYPVHLHFDSGTTPTAAELYNGSQSNPKCNDLRIVHDDTTELDRVVQNCSSTAIDIFFRTQVQVPAAGSDSTSHQLYYGNASAGTPLANVNNVFYPSADSNTVGLWHLEGNTDDSSTYGHNGQWLGDASWVNGKFGQGISLPGGHVLHGGIRVPGTETLRVWSFTIEAFVKQARADSNCGDFIASQGQSNEARERWHVAVEGDRLRLQIWNSGDKRSNYGAFPVDTNWHHVAATFNNSTHEFRFYRDGSQVYQGQMDSPEFVSGDSTFYIGSLFPYVGGEFNSFCGAIDGVRLSNVVRTSFLPYGSFTAITNEPTTAVGHSVDPPVPGSPDLVALSLDTYPNPDGGVLVQAVVQNQGDLSTQNGFYTDLYLDHLPIGAGDYTGSIQFWVNDPIAAGATVTLATVITDLPGVSGETSATLYAQVDSDGAVGEPDDVNNIYSAGTEICVASPDAYESDDTAETAKSIAIGQTQTHNSSGLGDQDWVKFTAQGGVTYTIQTSNLGLAADTYLYVYDTDGITLLAANDDYGGSLASRMDWAAPSDGTYYVLVRHWNPNVGGCGTSYTLLVDLPVDTEKPVVHWIAPVGDGEVYPVGDEVIQLEVDATDNVAVARVRFFRWDAVNEQWIDIDNDYTAPYQMNLDCSTLNDGWNQVNAVAYDLAGNTSDSPYIWLDRGTLKPDLHPYAPPGYPYPVVPSSVPGTHEVNTLYAGQTTYFDWHLVNSGDATASGSFHVELWVGDTRYVRYPYSDYGAGQSGGFDDWMETISTPGWHTVRLISDPDNTIDESDETNNVWERQFYWEPSGPLVYSAHTVDDDTLGQSSGNGDGIVNCGETIELYVDLYNQGGSTATGVNSTISTSDPYVTWLYNTDSSYPDIPGGGTRTNSDDFEFQVDPSTPDGHVIHFDLDIAASNGGPWSDSFDVPVVCLNNPPNTPSNPSPADGATNRDINVDLSWTGGDPDPGDTVTYDVYFEVNDSTPDNLICDDASTPACDPGTLAYDTHYYWYVVATDSDSDSTTGDTWDFYTGTEPNNPPYQPGNSMPADGATNVSITADLSWTGGDPDPGDTVTYDVYFEVNNSTPDNLICDDASTPACDPGTLAYDTHYYWYVVATDNHGASATGYTWDFTTESAPPTVGPLVYDSHTIDDDNSGQSSGNGNSIVNCGETIELYVDLYNQGGHTATGVNAAISSSDPYVTWLYNTESTYPDIPGGGTSTNSNDFEFQVDPNTPDGHVIHFDLDISASNGGPWSDSFDVPVACECYNLNTSVNPIGGGNITASPPPNCGGGQYTAGAQVQLTANSASGHEFSVWSGDASGSANPITVTMDSDKSVTANFIAAEPPEFKIYLPTVARNYPGMAQVRFALRDR